MKRYMSVLLCCLTVLTLVSCGAPASGESDPFDIDGSGTLGGDMEVTSEKTALNYLTGEYNMAQDRVGKKPYCIHIDNIAICWPQFGTSQADILIEMETEGGITRLMGVYSDYRELEKVGNIRSLRGFFIEALYSLDPILVHLGTTIYSAKDIAERGMTTVDFDNPNAAPQLQQAYYRDPARIGKYDKEYTYFTSGDLIHDVLPYIKLSEEATLRRAETFFNFAKAGAVVTPGAGAASAVKFDFSGNKSYDGDFRYDEASGTYLKFQRGQAQIDENNNTQLAFKNVLVLMANTKVIDKYAGIINVDYQAGGKGYYFSGGRYEEINWVKTGDEANFTFTKADGSDLVLNTGKTMLCVANSKQADSLVIAN